MMAPQSKLDHAHRLLRTLRPDRVKLLRDIARGEHRWAHVAWDRTEDPTPPPAAPLGQGPAASPLRPWRGVTPPPRLRSRTERRRQAEIERAERGLKQAGV